MARTDSINSGNTILQHTEANASASGASAVSETQFNHLVQELVSTGMFTNTQARQTLRMLPEQRLAQFNALVTGTSNLSLEDLAKGLGLSKAEVSTLLSPSNGVVLRTNPFGAAFLRLMQLTYSLEIDLKEMLKVMMQSQLDLSIEAANQRFQGAIVQFACAMAAGLITLGAGTVAFASWMKGKDSPALLRAAADNRWLSPIGLSLISQPINAAGEFGNQYHQFEAATTQAFAEEAGRLYEQLLNSYQTTKDIDKTMAQGA